MPMGERKTVYRGVNCTVDFEMDPKGIAKIAMGGELKDAVRSIAETKALPYAKSISPRSRRNEPGHIHYQDAFVVTPGSTVINQMRRVAARLWNMSPHAAAVEWGNAKNPDGRRILAKTLTHLDGKPR